MLTVNEALERILSQIEPLPACKLPLLESRGYVLADSVRADIDLPPFDNSAVDGYAVRAADVAGASADRPVLLIEVAEIPAGGVAEQPIGTGQCARVMTGAPMPPGADAMVMVEDSRRNGDGSVVILEDASSGDHIRPAGGDVRRGSIVLRRGTRIGPAEIAMLAAVGRVEVSVHSRPKVAVLSTGDELVEPELLPGPGQIRDSNRFAMAALVAVSGAVLALAQHIPDDEALTESMLRECADSVDVIITSGGVSVGDRDFIKPVVERLGSLDLWRVKMKPGKPLAFGRIGNALFFGLPGNPVSTMVTFELFVRPALWKMMGRMDLDRLRVPAILDQPVTHTPGREEFVRVRLTIRDGQIHVQPTGAQASGLLTSMLGANALLDIPEESGDLPAGNVVEALML